MLGLEKEIYKGKSNRDINRAKRRDELTYDRNNVSRIDLLLYKLKGNPCLELWD